MTDSQKPNAPSAAGSPDDIEPPGAIAHPAPPVAVAANTSESTNKPSRQNTGNPAGKISSKPAAQSPAPAGCKVRVRFQTDDCTPPLTRWLKEEFFRLTQLAKVTKGDITIVIVADEQMARMHEQFTGVKGTTDVLTFDHRDDKRQAIESDLVICVDTARREAASRSHDTRVEVLLYALHGLNHLLGGDDHTPAGAKAMHRWEDQILTAAGFGAVFNQPAKTDTTATKTSGKKASQNSGKPRPTSRSKNRSTSAAGKANSGKANSGDPRKWSNRKANSKKKKKTTHHPT